MDPLLIAARTLHFAAALSLVGILGFAAFVVSDPPPRLARQSRNAAWLSAALLLVTAPLWLILIATDMTGDTLAVTISSGALWTVLLDTQFGHALGLRFALTLLLLPLIRRLGKNPMLDRAAASIAAISAGAIAWQGHAGAGLGEHAVAHLLADVAHVIAAGLWLGALLPLILALRGTTEPDPQYETAKCFSTLGVVCVVVLLASGIVNAYYLVGSVPALIGTAYGQILLLKLVFVVAMLALAGVNRWRFVPRLLAPDGRAGRRIACHTAIEAALGFGVIATVAALGTMEPARHEPVVLPFGSTPPVNTLPAMPAMKME